MSESHLAYLSLGSNIQPEMHLVRAIEQLKAYGRIEKISSAWESRSVGAEGPNYLNACVLLVTSLSRVELKEQALHPIESSLGRQRGTNKFAPRTIDIDIILFDEKSCNDKFWEQAFVVIPLAEIYPEYRNPLKDESIVETAARLRERTWLKIRPTVLSQFSESNNPSRA